MKRGAELTEHVFKALEAVLANPVIFYLSCLWSYVEPLKQRKSSCNAGDTDSIPGLGRSPGAGNGNPLQYYCLENPMDREAWWAMVYEVAKSLTRLSNETTTKLRIFQVISPLCEKKKFTLIFSPSKFLSHFQGTTCKSEFLSSFFSSFYSWTKLNRTPSSLQDLKILLQMLSHYDLVIMCFL